MQSPASSSAAPSSAPPQSPKAASPKRKRNSTPPPPPADSPRPAAPSGASPKTPAKVDDGVNRTLGTQADPSLNGLAASKCPALSAYISMDAEARAKSDNSIQKPKKLSNDEWAAIAVPDRTLWVIYRRNLKEAEVTSEEFTFQNFQDFVKEQEKELQAFKQDRAAKLKALQDTNNVKIGRFTKAIDRQLRECIRNTKKVRAEIQEEIQKAFADPAAAKKAASSEKPKKKKQKSSSDEADVAKDPQTSTQ